MSIRDGKASSKNNSKYIQAACRLVTLFVFNVRFLLVVIRGFILGIGFFLSRSLFLSWSIFLSRSIFLGVSRFLSISYFLIINSLLKISFIASWIFRFDWTTAGLSNFLEL